MSYIGFQYAFGDGKKRHPVLEVFQERFHECAVQVNTAEELPDVLPHGVKWSDLNILVYPSYESRTWGCYSIYSKDDCFRFLQAFFDERKPLFLHVWESRLEQRLAKK